MSEPLEYTGLMAASWDAFRGDTSDWEDRHFFLDIIRERGGPILDVGCGTGRLLLDFLALGFDIDGLEVASDMLDRLEDKAAEAGLDIAGRLHKGRMEALDLPRRYGTIMVPSSSFQLLFAEADISAAMAGFRGHLAPGGTLAMPFMDITLDYPDGEDDRRMREAELADGSVIRRTSRTWFDPSTGFESTDELFERLRDGVVVETDRKVREPATRSYTQATAVALFESAGFDRIEVLSGFTRAPAAPSDPLVSVLGRRPD